MPHTDDHMQVLLSEPDIDRLRRTQRIYSKLLEREPENADALHALGVIAHQQGNYQGALDFLTRAIAANPDRPQYHITIGIVHEALGSLDLAVAAYERAISLQPDNSDAHHNLAIALQLAGNAEAAVNSAGRATQLRPDCSEFHNTLGYALRQCGRYDCAINSFRKAVSLKADYAEAYNQLGVTLNAAGRYDEAVESYHRAISIDPNYVEAHWNIALVLLLTGRFAEGWKEYRWRRHPDLEMVTYPHTLSGPRWDGSEFAGKTLLVHYEQGFGDVLHFVRYLPMVKNRGGTVILEARQPLRGLLEMLPGVDLFVEASDRHAPDVHYDFHVSLMDLPDVFGATEATIPADVPYIHADTIGVESWREHVNTSSFNVGIVWSGSVSYDRNNVRSCGLEDFAPLAAIEGVTLYSLQKGPPVSQIEQYRQSVPVVDLGCHINDFADTAAAIENMDLVVSVDTCVLHLAGAMGKPAWALICAAPEWRWLLNREDSPWYPTMRLFRQEHLGQWTDVFERVRRELERLVPRRSTTQDGHCGLLGTENRAPRPDARDRAEQLHLSSLDAYAAGRYDHAVDLIRQAISIDSTTAIFHNSLGLALEALGKPQDALSAYHVAVSLQNDFAEAYNNMAIVLNSLGRYAEAVEKCLQAVAYKPDFAQAYHAMGYAQQMQSDYERAAESYCLAIRFRTDFAEAYNHLGVVLAAQGAWEEAIHSHRRAAGFEPEYAEAYNNLGVALRELGDYAAAMENYSRAIRLEPDFAEARKNLANALKDQGRCKEAIESYRQAIRIDPDYAEAHWNLSLTLLLDGRFSEGWQQYGWRHKVNLGSGTYPHRYDMPLWDGAQFHGKRLLVHYEQGFGDTIQFVRYLPMVKARGGTVILEARKPLAMLFYRSLGVDEIVPGSLEHRPNVEADFHISVMDLPAIFGTTVETIPASVPYLHPDPCRVEYWRNRLSSDKFKVGLVWGGSVTHGNDRRRSCKLAQFEPLFTVPGIGFYGLQKGPQAAQADLLGTEMELINLGDELDDLDDTAAVIENLDLMISVDTSVAHLAGAIGGPVWTLLPFSPDWRWMLGRDDSPWYPTMRLFRQETPDRWDTVFESVTEELQLLAESGRRSISP